MCGVPVIRADEYLHRLIALGHRVAVCEQLEDPAEAKKRGAQERGAARRGAAGDARHADRRHAARRQAQQLPAQRRARAAVVGRRGGALRARLDRHFDRRVPHHRMRPAVARRPRSRGSSRARSSSPTRSTPTPSWRPIGASCRAVTPLTRDVFDGATAERRLTSFFAVATSEAFGALTRLELTAAAACVTYVERTQIGKRPPLSPPLRESAGATMAIDQATRGNLELMRTLAGERRGSLLDAIDRTVTVGRLAAAGAAAVGAAHRSGGDRSAARRGGELRRGRRGARRHALAACRRRPISPARWRGWRSAAAARAISPPSATASLAAADLARALGSLKDDAGGDRRGAARAAARPDGMLAAELAAALAAELPGFKRDGGFVREGYDAALDETRALRDESRRVVAALQARYADETGVRGAEDPPQQRARLFRRGHRPARRQAAGRAAQRAPSSTARRWPARCASPPPSSANWKPKSPAPPTARSGWSSTSSSDSSRSVIGADAPRSRNAPRRSPRLDVASALGAARGRARLRAPAGRRQPRLRHRGRPPSGGRAGAARATARPSSPTIATCRRRRTATPAASG